MKRLLLALTAGVAAGWIAREPRVRVAFKLALHRVRLIDSFCRDCGVDVRDFSVPDATWEAICGGKTGPLCYQCFAGRCDLAGFDPVWRLEPLPDVLLLCSDCGHPFWCQREGLAGHCPECGSGRSEPFTLDPETETGAPPF